MGYAVRKDGLGWRAVDSSAEIDSATETFSATQPVLTIPAQADPNGFAQAVKAALGGIVAANALAVAYPLFFSAVQSCVWADVQALVLDANAKAVITSAQYNAIKSAAAQFNIPITL